MSHIEAHRSCGNVFADLGLPDADDLLAEADRRYADILEQERAARETDFWVVACPGQGVPIFLGISLAGSAWIVLTGSEVNARVYGSREDGLRAVARYRAVLDGFEVRPLHRSLGLLLDGDFRTHNAG